MRHRLFLTTAVTVILGGSAIYAQERNVSSETMRYPSPDGTFLAIVTSLHKLGATPESKVELRTEAGTVLEDQSYTSDDGEHGYGVTKAQWTPDSGYFVFSLESSGGHQAWHSPVRYFSRKDHTFLSLDDALHNAVMSPQFIIGAPDKVTVNLYFGNKTVTASLSDLEAPKPAAEACCDTGVPRIPVLNESCGDAAAPTIDVKLPDSIPLVISKKD
jgi:hypothetical protein